MFCFQCVIINKFLVKAKNEKSYGFVFNILLTFFDVFQAINDREASDLLALMKNCEHAVTNADIFVEDLRWKRN